MKYVILAVEEKNLGITRVYPFIFPEYVVHADVAKYTIRLLGMEEGKEAVVRSAGFCFMLHNQWRAIHGSDSLGIQKDSFEDSEDERLLNMPDAMQGICHV